MSILRSLSSSSPSTHPAFRASVLSHRLPLAPVVTHSRPFSLASLFRRPNALPPPSVVANISKLETDADAHPGDVEKQVALFEALVNTKVKPGLSTVVARWERTSEFVSVRVRILSASAHHYTEPFASPSSFRDGLQIVSDGSSRPWP